MEHAGSTFLSGCAGSCGFFFFAKEMDELVEDDTPNASFFVYRAADAEAQFRKYDESVGWPAISMATIKPAGGDRLVVAVGPNGDYWELDPASTDERVGKISGFKGNLRKLSVVEDHIYACGMDRVVLRRTAAGQWRPLGPGAQKGDPSVVGFEDLAAFGEDEMYAVGWGGEIWWRDQGTWRRVDSPTSANLTALSCAADGFVYAVGHGGVMLQGRKDAWAMVDTGRDEDLRDVALREGKLLVVTDFEILEYVPGQLVASADFTEADDMPGTCLHLLEASDGLVSLGTKDVFIRPDGSSWRRLV